MVQQTLRALAEPNRLHIVEVLINGPRAVGEIVVQLQLSQPLVSKHLKTLSEAGIVESHKDAQRRIYQLRPEPFAKIDAWLETYRKHWKDRLKRLDAHLKDHQENTQ